MSSKQDPLLEELYRAYFKKLTLYAFSVLKNHAIAEELVQDTFITAIDQIDTLKTHENPGGWLMTTLKYKIRDSERTRIRYLRRFWSLDSDLSVELASPSDRITALHEEDEPDPLKTIENALTAEEYRFLTRLTLDKVSHMEMAQELGITVWASQKRLERIRNKLRPLFPDL